MAGLKELEPPPDPSTLLTEAQLEANVETVSTLFIAGLLALNYNDSTLLILAATFVVAAAQLVERQEKCSVHNRGGIEHRIRTGGLQGTQWIVSSRVSLLEVEFFVQYWIFFF